MSMLGVLFDIEVLDDVMYGYAAYRIFFGAVDRRLLAGSMLSDGDTQATLDGAEYRYCIAVESENEATLAAVKEALTRANAPGLAPLPIRFMSDRLVRDEPLVFAAYVGADARLHLCETSWVQRAFDEAGRG